MAATLPPGTALVAGRNRALRRIAALAGDVDSIIGAADSTTLDDEHDPEGATIAFERAQASALLAAAHADLAAIDHALERVRAGTYPSCERCGRPVGVERQQARPAATRCVRCAAAG